MWTNNNIVYHFPAKNKQDFKSDRISLFKHDYVIALFYRLDCSQYQNRRLNITIYYYRRICFKIQLETNTKRLVTPNQLHVLIDFRTSVKSVNTIVSNGKKFYGI